VSTHLLLEAAARTLVMGAIILLALRLMRIEQVRARRTAWLLALSGALAMPLLVSAKIGPRLLPDLSIIVPRTEATASTARGSAPSSAASLVTPQAASLVGSSAAVPTARPDELSSVYGVYRGPLSNSRAESTQDRPARITPPIDYSRHTSFAAAALSLAVFGYCVVAAMLALRLCAGVGFALRLRNHATRLAFAFDPDLDVRTSERVSSPVTIGSSVLLPENYTSWDEATLRVVLSHERAHVRQKDFLIHTLAGLHCALFWFNPFSWWLRRQLAELGEALSDCAAVEQAESRAGYAEILLAFATRSRWQAGVAMASASNLTPRIERLLNDQGFERSFARARRLPFIAAGVVALAMFASTSMVRVQASPTEVPAPPDTPATPVAPQAPAQVAPNPPAAPAQTVPSPPSPPSPPVPRAPDEPVTSSSSTTITTDTHHSKKSDEDGVLAIKTDHSNTMWNRGNRLPSRSGDYIYFQHNGKPYLIQDPQVIAKAQELLAPMKMLGEKQRLLGTKQATLGIEQQMLSSHEHAIKLAESPEFKQRIAELEKRIQELDLPHLTVNIDEHALADLQAHLGEIQARVGELQLNFGSGLADFGEQMGKLGEQQGKLGEQQALLGEQQRKIIEDVQRQLKPMIEQAIRDGKGTQLKDWD
jgi:beta-lactamase regulating signal transducer with metallopeptidase domain